MPKTKWVFVTEKYCLCNQSLLHEGYCCILTPYMNNPTPSLISIKTAHSIVNNKIL